MSDERWKTLFHPFERQLLDPPGGDERWLFAAAEPGFRLPEGFAAQLSVVQTMKPAHDRLAAQGLAVSRSLEELDTPRFDGALMLLDRDRGGNETRLFEAAMRVRPGGMIVVAGTNRDGASSFAKRLAGDMPTLESASKHHGTVMWFRRPDDRACEHILPAPAPETRVEERFVTRAGVFSHAHADPGSVLLLEHLPDRLTGHIADFGAGWGYLARHVAERHPHLAGIDLYESDWAALALAERNMAGSPVPARFFWHDIAGEAVTRAYDAIVMNPPFHAGRRAEPSLGEAFIARAAQALKPSGRLYLVANRQLPYERVLAACFGAVTPLADAQGYKVISAERPRSTGALNAGKRSGGGRASSGR